jgi:phosphoglycerol transferase MdoB-like AlkP superfamily enzyme
LNKLANALIRYAAVLVGGAVLFFALRIVFYAFNFTTFQSVAFSEILYAFLVGLRFDLIAIGYLFFIPILLFSLPLKPRHKFVPLYNAVLVLVLVLSILPNLIDAAYFQFSGRRTGKEMFLTFSDAPSMLMSYVRDFGYVVLLFAGLVWLSFKWIKKLFVRFHTELSQLKTLPYLIVLVVINLSLVLMVRGGTQLRPLRSIDASRFVSSNLIGLTLNTQVQFISTLSAQQLSPNNLLSDEEIRKVFTTEKIFEGSSKRPHIVLLIVESLSKEHMGYFNNDNPSFTPFLDSLAKHCLVFENAFANGRRSIDAIPSIMAGIPDWMYEPFISSFYQNNKYKTIGAYLKELGYVSEFYHGGDNQTMNLSGFLAQGQNGSYFGIDEYPDKKEDFDGNWGIYDDKYLQYCANQFINRSEKEPYFQTIFTLSSHHPYPIPDDLKGQFPEGKTPLMKALAYTDYSIRNYFNKLKNSNQFNDTWFIITGDHTAELHRKAHYHISDYFSVPILLYKSGITAQINKQLCEHIDLLPTLLQLAGYKGKIECLGTSILDSLNTESKMVILQNQGTFIGLMDTLLIEYCAPERIVFQKWINTKYEPFEPDDVTKKYLQLQLNARLHTFRKKMISNTY